MSPFRTRADELPPDDLAPTAEVRDAVSQMVGQFADPHAFYRELVQNSIDAGARTVDVRLTFDPPAPDAAPPAEGREPLGTLRVVVRDDGEGMDRATIEGCLLVLFRSSKDGDPTKIGKFGVGFFSVFAVRPERVLVDTARRGASEGHRVVLAPDFTYELGAGPPREGTAITVRVPLASSEAASFVERSRAALARWCPHVRVELTFGSAGVPGVEDATVRIDRPLDLGAEGAVAAVLQPDPDGARYALGVMPADGVARAGIAYYNRGILLYAASESIVQGVTVRVDSPALHHTLSRDDVRRDAAFERVQARVRELARAALRPAVVAVLAERAEAIGRARAAGEFASATDSGHFVALCDAARLPVFALRAHELRWPLAHPVHAAPAVHSARLDTGFAGLGRKLFTLFADHAPLAWALARRGEPVVDLSRGAVGQASTALVLFRELYGDGAEPAAERYGVPRVVRDDALAEDPAARALLLAVRGLLAGAGLPAVALADPLGAGAARLFLALPPRMIDAPDPLDLIDAADAEASPFALLGNRGVALNRAHPRVQAATRAAARDPDLAALVLARLVLLAAGRLDAARDAALFARATASGGSAGA